MSQSALLIIDVQQSFQHRPFWQEDDLPAFQQALTRLIAGCQQRGAALVDVLHVSPQGPFSLASGHVQRLPFLTHRADITVHKHVHNALTESGLDAPAARAGYQPPDRLRHPYRAVLRNHHPGGVRSRLSGDFRHRGNADLPDAPSRR